MEISWHVVAHQLSNRGWEGGLRFRIPVETVELSKLLFHRLPSVLFLRSWHILGQQSSNWKYYRHFLNGSGNARDFKWTIFQNLLKTDPPKNIPFLPTSSLLHFIRQRQTSQPNWTLLWYAALRCKPSMYQTKENFYILVASYARKWMTLMPRYKILNSLNKLKGQIVLSLTTYLK